MSVFRITRFNIIRNGKHPTILANFSDDAKSKKGGTKEESSADKKDKKEKQDGTVDDKKKVNSTRLNDLLAMMSTDTNYSIVKEVVKPISAAEKKERRKAATVAAEKREPKSTNIADAAKLVAKALGGDTEKTESELLAILLKSDNEPANRNLNSLIGDMKVETTASPPLERRSDIVRKSMSQKSKTTFDRQNVQTYEGMQRPKRDRRDQQSKSVRVSVDLFGGKPLGIFTTASDLQDSPDILPTWNYLQNRELKLAVTHPPKNYFEKMARWTEQGKLWKFPIDNEQGMDDEAKIYFTEHIFLDKHLESWCPKRGPVRHFMELVCVGLSKNPYYTVAQKREHIEWYRDYFANKKELLDSVIIDSDAPKELQQ